jgi:hypothetical protein
VDPLTTSVASLQSTVWVSPTEVMCVSPFLAAATGVPSGTATAVITRAATAVRST